MALDDIAHELWAAAQLVPGEAIADGVDRIVAILGEVELKMMETPETKEEWFKGAKLKTTPNTVQTIDQLWAFISSDDTGEGLCAFQAGNVMMPMVAADEKRLNLLVRLAQSIARQSGKTVKLINLSTREDLKEFKP